MDEDDLENESVRGNGDPALPVENTDRRDVPVPSNQLSVPWWLSCLLYLGGVKAKLELRSRPSKVDNPWGWEALVSALPRLLLYVTYELQRIAFIALSIWA